MKEPGRVHAPPRWVAVVLNVLFFVTVLGGVAVAAWEFASPHPPRSRQTKPWLDR